MRWAYSSAFSLTVVFLLFDKCVPAQDTTRPGILIANLVGSFLLGLFAAAFSAGVMSSQAYSLWGVGFCGALTTLSTLNVELVTMLRHHHTWQAVAYLLGTVLGGLALGAIAGLFTFN